MPASAASGGRGSLRGSVAMRRDGVFAALPLAHLWFYTITLYCVFLSLRPALGLIIAIIRTKSENSTVQESRDREATKCSTRSGT
jgi:hypothetical protein